MSHFEAKYTKFYLRRLSVRPSLRWSLTLAAPHCHTSLQLYDIRHCVECGSYSAVVAWAHILFGCIKNVRV